MERFFLRQHVVAIILVIGFCPVEGVGRGVLGDVGVDVGREDEGERASSGRMLEAEHVHVVGDEVLETLVRLLSLLTVDSELEGSVRVDDTSVVDPSLHGVGEGVVVLGRREANQVLSLALHQSLLCLSLGSVSPEPRLLADGSDVREPLGRHKLGEESEHVAKLFELHHFPVVFHGREEGVEYLVVGAPVVQLDRLDGLLEASDELVKGDKRERVESALPQLSGLLVKDGTIHQNVFVELLHHFLEGGTLLWVRVPAALCQLAEALRTEDGVVRELGPRRILLLADRSEKVGELLVFLERLLQSDELVESDSKRIDVPRVVNVVTLQSLWGDIEGSSRTLVSLEYLSHGNQKRQSKVTNFH